MDKGTIFTVLGLIFYSSLGFLYKMIVYKNCNIKNTLFIGFLCSMFICFLVYLFSKNQLISLSAIVIGIIGGISLYLAIYWYVKSLALGRKITSWVIFKMSLVIAVAISIFLWGEKPTLHQIIGFVLILLAIILLGIDAKIKKEESDVG